MFTFSCDTCSTYMPSCAVDGDTGWCDRCSGTVQVCKNPVNMDKVAFSVTVFEDGITPEQKNKSLARALQRFAAAIEGGEEVFDMLTLWHPDNVSGRIGYVGIEVG